MKTTITLSLMLLTSLVQNTYAQTTGVGKMFNSEEKE